MEGALKNLPVKKLVPSNDNTRERNDPDAGDLVASIRAMGVLVPLIVRPHPNKRGFYEVRAGERRLNAALQAGLTEVPCIEREMDDMTASEVTITENLHRRNLTPFEEASAIQTCLDKGWTLLDVAKDLGKSSAWIMRRAKLTNLASKWRKEADDPESMIRQWPAANWEIIARLDMDVQDTIYKDMKETNFRNIYPEMSSSQLEHVIADYTHELGKAPWNLDEGSVWSCRACTKRSSARPGLFDAINLDDPKEAKKDRCLDPTCWEKKMRTHLAAKIKQTKAEHSNLVVVAESTWNNKRAAAVAPKIPLASTISFNVAKKTDKGAVPALNLDTGVLSWVKKPNYGTTEKREKKTATIQGDPIARQQIADDFARAHLAYYLGFGETAGLPWGTRGGTIMAVSCLAAGGGAIVSEFGSGHRADMWLRAMIGVPLGIEARTFTVDQYYNAVHDEPQDLYDSYLEGVGVAGFTEDTIAYECIRRVLTLGFYRTLRNGVWFPLEDGHVANARASFVISRAFLTEHTKADLMVISKELNVPIKAGSKVDQVVQAILDANLPAGTTTSELNKAFEGLESNQPSLKDIKKKIAKIKKAKGK